jgi:hypothetical protein
MACFTVTNRPRRACKEYASCGVCVRDVHIMPQLHFYLSIIFFLYYWWGGTEFLSICSSPWYCGHFGLLYKSQMIDEDDFWSNWWNEFWQGKPKYSEKTCPSATLSTTKSHMTRPGLEPRTAAVGNQRLTA